MHAPMTGTTDLQRALRDCEKPLTSPRLSELVVWVIITWRDIDPVLAHEARHRPTCQSYQGHYDN
jgi:hypothetical protein